MIGDSDKIAKIISDYLKGNLSDEDRLMLDKWLLDDNNKVLFQRLIKRQLYQLKNKQYKRFENDKDRAWKSIQDTTRKRLNLKRYMQYAAAILIPLLLFFSVYQLSHVPKKDVSASVELVKPGERKAFLQLSNGEWLELASADTTITTQEGQTTIKIDSLGARYDESNGSDQVRFNTIQTSKGMEYDLLLADGTHVWLNSESRLRFPEQFSADTREVFADGEVFFEVAQDQNKPFVVNFNDKKIKVLGTEFNVRNYSDEKNDVITLVEGSIELTTQKEKILMVPNNQISISRNDGSSVLNNVNASVYGAWRDGKFVYDKMPLKQIISDIARWYQVDVFYQNPSVQSKRISMFTKKSNEINDILEIIEAAEDVRFELNGNSLLVRSK